MHVAGGVVNLLLNEAVERALPLTQPSGLILSDLGKLHKPILDAPYYIQAA